MEATATREATAVTAATAQFLQAYEATGAARQAEPPWLRRRRDEALSRFAARGFPTPREEDWKYTNVAPLHDLAYEHRGSSPGAAAGVSSAELDGYLLADCDRFVVVDGRFAAGLSSIDAFPAGVVVRNLGDLWRGELDPAAAALIEQHLGRVVDPALPFSALNTALAGDGALVHVGVDVELMRPLQLIYVSTGRTAHASYPRNLIVCGDRSKATVIETYVGLGGQRYLTNAVTEAVLGRDALLDHAKLQLEAAGAFHVATVEALQERRSEFRSLSVSLGGRLVRNDINARLDAEGSACTFDGLYVAGGEQHVDHHTAIDHRKPGCNSREHYRGILDGRATSVFNGKVFVREGAVRTDARQSNRNLLLSEDATVNTKPQLEIFADDVRCTHGATVGQLDDEALFYLRTRGLSAEQAREALVSAFAGEIVEEVEYGPLRTLLAQQLRARLGGSRVTASQGLA